MYAAKAGYLEIVKLLLDHGAFVNARNAVSYYPTHTFTIGCH